MAWRRSVFFCDADTIQQRTPLRGGSKSLICQSGCLGTLGSMSSYCTDFSESENWVSGERIYEVDVETNTSSFEASLVTNL